MASQVVCVELFPVVVLDCAVKEDVVASVNIF